MAKRGVSVIVPVQNASRWIEACVRNLNDVADPDSEVLFVENASTDDTLEKLRHHTRGDARFRILQSPAGIVPALNLGLQESRNEWVMRHDADDVSRPDRIQRFFRFLDLDPNPSDLGLVCSNAIVANESDQILSQVRVGEGRGFVHGSVFLHRARVLAAGGYSTALPHAEDQDLWARLKNRGHRFGYLSETLYWFRSHGRSVSSVHLLLQLKSFRDESSEPGVWSPRVRSAIARLAWDQNRLGALNIAISQIRRSRPVSGDFAVPLRILFGSRLDRVRAEITWGRDREARQLIRYAQERHCDLFQP